MPNSVAQRVLLIGWEGADLALLESLLAAGRLPHLSALLEQGAAVPINAPRPAFTDAVWTSLATGVRPHTHGVLAPPRPLGVNHDLRTIPRTTRRAPALWDRLTTAKRTAHVVGWPVTHPVEFSGDVCVSDQFLAKHAERDAFSPAKLAPALRALRVAPTQIQEITVTQLFTAERTDLPPELHPQLFASCQSLLAEAASVFRIFGACLSTQPWEFAAAVFPGLRRGHELAAWLHAVAPAATAARKELLTGCYEHHDLLLGQLLPHANRETLVVSIAPPTEGSMTELSGAGMVVFSGAGVRPATRSAPQCLLDIAPTILAALGVPLDGALAGRSLSELFEPELSPTFVAAVKQFAAESPTALPASPCDQSVAHLVALGYVDPQVTAAQEERTQFDRVAKLNSVISLLDAGETELAHDQLEQLIKVHSGSIAARLLRAEFKFRAGLFAAARADLDWLAWHGVESDAFYQLAGALDLAERRISDAYENLRSAVRGGQSAPGRYCLLGEACLRKRDYTAAVSAFETAIEHDDRSASAGLAAALAPLGRYEESAGAALDALEFDPRSPRAHYWLARALVGLNRPTDAAQALTAWAALDPENRLPRFLESRGNVTMQ